MDSSSSLVEMAHHRCSNWSDRFYTGNAIHWQPSERFDYVRTELVYVPPPLQPTYVERLLSEVVAPGGRVIICS